MNICITGHRPNKLYGYDLSDYRWKRLQFRIVSKLQEYHCDKLYCGMALGVDQVAAMACIELKELGNKIQLIGCIPFKGQESKWSYKSQQQYYDLVDKCDEVITVCDGGYAPYKMMERNRFMVDQSDMVLAVWDGSDSGTGNCVKYAQSKGKDIVNLLD